MAKKIHSDPYNFSEFCEKYNKFQIPPFQRAYSWMPKQIDALWEDLTTNEKEYFIGNIVALDASPESDGRLVIIDGQQRLFTITLILTAIRDEYRVKIKKDDKPRAEKTRDRITKFLFHEELVYPFSEELRFLPRREEYKDVYERLLKNDKDIINDRELLNKLDENQQRYIRNYKKIRTLIRQSLHNTKGTERLNTLDMLLEKVLTLTFIVIVCDTDSDAFTLFEGLNATGIGLTIADLVKNAALQAASNLDPRTQIQVEDAWKQMEDLFAETRSSLFPKFLRHQWISKNGYITTSALFDRIKKEKLSEKTNKELLSYTDELLGDAKVYLGLRFEDYSNYLDLESVLLDAITRFRLLNVDQVYELLLTYYNKFNQTKHYTQNQFLRDLERLWNFCFRASILAVNPSEYERKFAEQCSKVVGFRKKEMGRMSSSFFTDLRKLVSDDETFIGNFPNSIKYGRDSELIKHLLDTIMREGSPSIKIAEPTIEHILPRHPEKWGYKKEDVKDFVDKIGNLTLLYEGDNKALGNDVMKVKMDKVYSASHFELNKKLRDYQKDFEKSPEKAIDKRGVDIARYANKIWSL